MKKEAVTTWMNSGTWSGLTTKADYGASIPAQAKKKQQEEKEEEEKSKTLAAGRISERLKNDIRETEEELERVERRIEASAFAEWHGNPLKLDAGDDALKKRLTNQIQKRKQRLALVDGNESGGPSQPRISPQVSPPVTLSTLCSPSPPEPPNIPTFPTETNASPLHSVPFTLPPITTSNNFRSLSSTPSPVIPVNPYNYSNPPQFGATPSSSFNTPDTFNTPLIPPRLHLPFGSDNNFIPGETYNSYYGDEPLFPERFI